MKSIILASNNKDKVKEVKEILKGYDIIYELFNEAWVNDGEHDSVEGDVLDKKVPSTGGMGRGMFTGLGLLFMGTAAAAWKRKRSM